MLNNHKVLGSSLFLAGILLVFDSIDFYTIAAVTFLYYGIVTVFVNFNKGTRSLIFIGAVLFQLGVLMIVQESYQLMDRDHFFITAFTFMGGTGFLLLYIENMKQFPLLVSGVSLIIMSIFAKYLTSVLGRFSLMANIGLVMMGYWALFLIFFGAAILVSRLRK